MDAGESLERLKEGNRLFSSGKPSGKDLASQRKATAGGQSPYAIVLTCSDSRVPPEHIFSSGIGELFVIRTAGNIADSVAIGSIEYAAEHLHAPLLVVMGHESCGAVNAACASDCAPGNINTIVREIQPAVRAGAKEPSKVIEANVKCVLNTIRKKSEILRLLEKGGKLKMAGAVYSFSTGAVSFL